MTLFESISKMFQGVQLNILPQKMPNRDMCLIRDKSMNATSQMCPLNQLCAPNHGCRGCKSTFHVGRKKIAVLAKTSVELQIL